MTEFQRGVAAPQADVTVDDAAWHEAIEIPAGTVAIRVYSDQPVYAVPTDSEDDPAATGEPTTAGVRHEIGCYGATHLHLRKVSATATVQWSAVAG
ncbi:MAG TPA: hypothetical protein VM695_04880, partial [Phycisphaerae bacterium]|nr:hypothetical protein [Phycisphaerae bacterium]